MTDLRYHRHMDEIAKTDIEYLRKKDAQYNASWKKRDGVGAFFTIARPWDRLENIARTARTYLAIETIGYTAGRINEKAVAPYDIFGIIAYEGLQGPDGSLIACVRDLRRYLLLVEAEMTERKLLADAKHNSGQTDTWGRSIPVSYPSGPGVYTEDGFKPGTPEDGGHHEQQSGSGGNAGSVDVSITGGNSGMTAKGGYGGGGSVNPDGMKYSDVKIGGVAVDPEKVEYLASAAIDPAIAEARKQPKFLYSADGVQNEEDKLKGFAYLGLDLGSTRYWILDRTKLNVDERDNLPQLQREMNDKEYQLSPLWYRPLYVWQGTANKWALSETYREHWGETP